MDSQTLTDTAIDSSTGQTDISFTKLLQEPGEIEIVPNSENVMVRSCADGALTKAQISQRELAPLAPPPPLPPSPLSLFISGCGVGVPLLSRPFFRAHHSNPRELTEARTDYHQ